jgi:hypothetical protein
LRKRTNNDSRCSPLKWRPSKFPNNGNGDMLINLDESNSVYIISSIVWSRGLMGGFGRVVNRSGGWRSSIGVTGVIGMCDEVFAFLDKGLNMGEMMLLWVGSDRVDVDLLGLGGRGTCCQDSRLVLTCKDGRVVP